MLTWLVLIGGAWLVRWLLGGPLTVAEPWVWVLVLLIVVYGAPAAPDPRERVDW